MLTNGGSSFGRLTGLAFRFLYAECRLEDWPIRAHAFDLKMIFRPLLVWQLAPPISQHYHAERRLS